MYLCVHRHDLVHLSGLLKIVLCKSDFYNLGNVVSQVLYTWDFCCIHGAALASWQVCAAVRELK